MKFNKVNLIFLLSGIALTGIAFVAISRNSTETVVQTPAHKCECGPTEHWFYKSCVKNYNKQFPDAHLEENNDTEGLSENVLQAIEMFALDIQFVDENNSPIQLELNKQGNLFLPLFKNPKFMLGKKVLRNVDVSTTLPAQNLYKQWTTQLNDLK